MFHIFIISNLNQLNWSVGSRQGSNTHSSFSNSPTVSFSSYLNKIYIGEFGRQQHPLPPIMISSFTCTTFSKVRYEYSHTLHAQISVHLKWSKLQRICYCPLSDQPANSPISTSGERIRTSSEQIPRQGTFASVLFVGSYRNSRMATDSKTILSAEKNCHSVISHLIEFQMFMLESFQVVLHFHLLLPVHWLIKECQNVLQHQKQMNTVIFYLSISVNKNSDNFVVFLLENKGKMLFTNPSHIFFSIWLR